MNTRIFKNALPLIIAGVLASPAFEAKAGPCSGGAAPEYWVAPMDPNFRREAPGKSPMGMDLVPYCAKEEGAADVSIAPQVVQNLGIRTTSVREQTLTPRIRAVGTVGWNEDSLRHIHTRAEGWVEELGVSAVGDTVQKGQRLYALYSPKLYAAEAEYLAAGNKALREAAARRLRALGYTTEQVAAVARQGEPTERMEQVATADLTVVSLGARTGQFVTPGSMMMVLADPRRVWLTVQVAERDAARVKKGQKAQAQVAAWPDRRWDGVVEHVYPELDPMTRTLKVRLAFDNADGALQPNMYAGVLISADEATPGLVVPASAVIRAGTGARVVKALGDGNFDVVAVRTGHSQDGQTQILDGLSSSDRVVTSGQFLLDSEANVDAEALRLSVLPVSGAEPMAGMPMHDSPAGMAEAEVIDIDRESRNVLLQHGDFEPMGDHGMEMPGMTMGFSVADDVDLSSVNRGDTVHVVVENPKPGVYTVKQLHNMGSMKNSKSMPMDGMRPMDHSSHGMGGSAMPDDGGEHKMGEPGTMPESMKEHKHHDSMPHGVPQT